MKQKREREKERSQVSQNLILSVNLYIHQLIELYYFIFNVF